MSGEAEEDGVRFGALLRALRERALLTQEELAERSGLNVRTIRRFEAAESGRPRSASLRQLTTALELDAAERAAVVAAARGADPVVARILRRRGDVPGIRR